MKDSSFSTESQIKHVFKTRLPLFPLLLIDPLRSGGPDLPMSRQGLRNCYNTGFVSQPALFSLVLIFSSSSLSSSSTRHISSRFYSCIQQFFRRRSARESKRRFHLPSSILIGASLLPLLLLMNFVSLLSSRGRSRSRSNRSVSRGSPYFP